MRVRVRACVRQWLAVCLSGGREGINNCETVLALWLVIVVIGWNRSLGVQNTPSLTSANTYLHSSLPTAIRDHQTGWST